MHTFIGRHTSITDIHTRALVLSRSKSLYLLAKSVYRLRYLW